MKKKILFIGIIGAVLLITACGNKPKLANGGEVVASIDGYNVTADDIYKELKKKYGTNIMINLVDQFIADKDIKDQSNAKKIANDKLASTKAQYEQAGMNFADALQQSGFQSESEYLQVLVLDQLRSELARNYLIKNVTDEEINKYYDNEIFGEETVRHILIKPKADDNSTAEQKTKAEADAKKTAEDIIKKLEGGAKFEDLAKEYSDDGTASQGGLFADFTKQQVVPEFWTASHNLKNNEYTKAPVKTTYGYHVILKVSSKEKPALKDVKDTVIDYIVDAKIKADTKIIDKTLDKIRKSYNLNITDTDIDKTYKSIISSINSTQ